MKPVSLKTQRILMLIPYVNAVNWFVFLYNCHCLRPPHKQVWKAVAVALLCAVPVEILEPLLTALFPQMERLIAFAAMYVSMLALSFGLIRMQSPWMEEVHT